MNRLLVQLRRLGATAGLGLALGCGTVESPVSPDAAPVDTVRESRSVSSAGGRVTRGSLVLDVEIGFAASRASSAAGAKQWRSGAPVNP